MYNNSQSTIFLLNRKVNPMGLFDIFRKKKKQHHLQTPPVIAQAIPTESQAVPIPKSEKQVYQPDEYYTNVVYEGSTFEQKVITFEERKNTCVPSSTGLYVAEILLLEYCSHGKYPSPKNGYPGFWWFVYGIRNVGAALSCLEKRGYIKFCSIKTALKGLTVSDLKVLLKQHGLPSTGKKSELIENASANISDADLVSFGLTFKYELTELGQTELEENAYVPYMHKHPRTTNDSAGTELAFNVWTINRKLGNNKSNWKEIVDREESRVFCTTEANHKTSMEQLSEFDSTLFDELKRQDRQLELIQQTETNLEGDTNALIIFWENIWKGDGLLFEGSAWHFRLPDLYIKAQRYDEAISFCKMIIAKKPTYANKAESYIERLKQLNKR